MLLLLSLLACDDQIFTGGGGHSAVDGSGAEAVLSASCGGCHASSLAPTLLDNICENTVGVTATQVDMPFITAGDPENSYVLHKNLIKNKYGLLIFLVLEDLSFILNYKDRRPRGETQFELVKTW